jgi:predicted transcriptional regulator
MKRTVFVASARLPIYDELMSKAKKFDLEDPAPIFDDKDEETLAAIDEGIRDADSGRVVSAEQVREDWVAIALQMQRDARASLATERQRMREILTARGRNQSTKSNE